MGKYSTIVDGKVLDWKCTTHYRLDGKNWSYKFYLGDKFLGTLHKHGSERRGNVSWCSISHGKLCPYGLVTGFRTRHDAIEFLLKVNGYLRERVVNPYCNSEEHY